MSGLTRFCSLLALGALAGCAGTPQARVPDAPIALPLQGHVAPGQRGVLADGDDPGKYVWNLRQIGLGGYRVAARTGARTVVAVLDTGADPKQPGLAGLAYPMEDVVGRDIYEGPGRATDFTGVDGNGHGTHVAGIVTAVSAGFNVHVLPIKVIPNSGVGDDHLLAQGIEKALAWRDGNGVGVRVLNLSVSSPRRSERLEKAIQRAADAGMLVVGASGNEGKAVDFPATMPEVLAVGATTVVDQIASYSCTGAAVDLAAPGGSDDMPIYSTWPTYLTSSDLDAGLRKAHTRAGLVGTSMAAPHVAAMAAITWSLHPELSAAQVRAQLLAMADDHGKPGPDSDYGFGRLNYARVLGGIHHDAH